MGRSKFQKKDVKAGDDHDYVSEAIEQGGKKTGGDVKVDVPESRIQNDMKTETTYAANKTSAPKTTVEPVKVKAKGSQVKQEVAATVVSKGSAYGSSGIYDSINSGDELSYGTLTFSGDGGTILGNVSGTPIEGKGNQGTYRVDKRINDANKEINHVASEQILVEYDHIPPLSASSSTVGYNGNPANSAVRVQKNTGITPAQSLYDRSLDYVTRDDLIYSVGQVVKGSADYRDYPTKYDYYDSDSEEWVIEASTSDFVRGNYRPKAIKASFTKDSTGTYLSSFAVEEDDLSVANVGDEYLNESSANEVIDINTTELARQTIDQKAGSPSSEHFNPLGRSVTQPSQTLLYLRDMEAVAGAEVYTAYRFANKARGFYLNRTAKDGQDLIMPAIDALYGQFMGATGQEVMRQAFQQDEYTDTFFSYPGLIQGSAALIPAIYDSPSKYKNKADFVTQSRGLKMPILTAGNNIEVFHIKPEFEKALNYLDCFSTIDHEYDPMAPLYIEDNVGLIHPYSWSKALKFTRTSATGSRDYDDTLFTYHYAAGDGQNVYFVKCGEPVLNGVAYFLEQNAYSIYNALTRPYRAYADSSSVPSTFELTIPIVHSTTHFALWDLLVCASVPYIVYERTNTLKDVLDYERFCEWPFPALKPIKVSDVLNPVNYAIKDQFSPLISRQMTQESAFRWIYPEVFQPSTLTPDNSSVLLPFYFSQRDFSLSSTVSTVNDYTVGTLTLKPSGNITTPVIRSGVRSSYVDWFTSYSPKDVLLMEDRLVRVPFSADYYSDFDDDGYQTCYGGFYKYSLNDDGMVVVYPEKYASTELTIGSVLRTPRMLGYIQPAFAFMFQSSSQYDATSPESIISAFDGLSDDYLDNTVLYGSPYKARLYKALTAANVRYDSGSVNSLTSIVVGRAQAFVQEWFDRYSAPKFIEDANGFDLFLTTNDSNRTHRELIVLGGDSPEYGYTTTTGAYSPYVTLRTTSSSGITYESDDEASTTGTLLMPIRAYWTNINKLCFVCNPFYNAASVNTYHDPFEVAYMFNLAGFMAADYKEEIDNRVMDRMNLGFGFTKDPWIDSSLIFKR